MIYHHVGTAGLKVSSLCLGTMTFGNGADEATSAELYGMARDAGLNCFDCANVYAGGESERILGRLIKAHRHEVVVATKAFYPVGAGPNDRGLSRLHLARTLDESLRRLDTDHVDIFYFHNFDVETPLEESLAAVDDFVRQGKVRYLGLSNFSAWQVMKAMVVIRANGLTPPVCVQPMYNLLKRQCEAEILPMALSEGLGVFPYSPLGGGLLTGKYLRAPDDDGRFSHNEMYQKRYADPENARVVEAFCAVAAARGHEPASLAVAWAASHPGVTAPIIGARTTEQLATVLGALDVAMDPEFRAEIAALSFEPAPANDRSEERAGFGYAKALGTSPTPAAPSP